MSECLHHLILSIPPSLFYVEPQVTIRIYTQNHVFKRRKGRSVQI